MPETTTASRAPARAKRGSYAKSSETQEKILAAAWDVANERGLHGVSLSAVASRAGVAVGNVSYHFGSLDGLVRALMRSIARQVRDQVIQPAAGGRDYFERLEVGFRAYLEFVHQHPAYVRMGDELRHHRPELHRRFVDAWLELHRDGIRQGIDDGSLRAMSDDEIATTAHFIIGTSSSLEQMLAVGGDDGDEDDYPGDDVVVGTFMNILRGGLERSR